MITQELYQASLSVLRERLLLLDRHGQTPDNFFDPYDGDHESNLPTAPGVRLQDEIDSRTNYPWHDVGATPPASWYGPIHGTKQELARLLLPTSMARDPSRTLDQKLRREHSIMWGRKQGPREWGIWFRHDEYFESIEKRRLALGQANPVGVFSKYF